jgi:hypothetical protein
MKLSRSIAIMAAGVMAAAIGVVSAPAASAATPDFFCVDYTQACAVPEASGPVKMGDYLAPVHTWLYNGPGHGPTQIQQNGADLCMQLDHAAGNLVIEAKCNGASYQKWQAKYIIVSANPANDGDEYMSEWDSSLCLTYNESKAYLDAVTCQGNAWYQAFGD